VDAQGNVAVDVILKKAIDGAVAIRQLSRPSIQWRLVLQILRNTRSRHGVVEVLSRVHQERAETRG
jgi:hypothetical protein